ncbi:MAG: acyl-CoA dehydrogenase family protein [Desulfomonilaceae bacterium]|nr:acyl-CoA dehydrogenase family protein [Desulfomonilaceae bacterium]
MLPKGRPSHGCEPRVRTVFRGPGLRARIPGRRTVPIARAWRDVSVMSIFAGTDEIMKTIVAKSMGL